MSAAPDSASPRQEAGLLGGAAVTLAGAGLGGALLFANEVLAARLLGLETYGLFALAITAAKIGEKLAVFGLHVSALHYLPIERQRGAFGAARGTAITAVGLSLTIGLALSGVLYNCREFIAIRWFGQGDLAALIAVTCLAIPLLAMNEVLGNLARAFGRPAFYVYARNLTPQIALTVVLGLALANAWPASAAAWAFVFAASAGCAAGLAAAWRAMDAEVFTSRTQWQVAERIRYALPVMLNSILYVLIGWTDIFMLGAFAKPGDVAIYRAITQIVIVFDMLSVAFNAATANRFSVASDAGAQDTLRATYLTALKFQLPLALCALVVIASNDRAILHLLGPDFTRGADALLLLATAAAVHCCFGTAGFLMVMTGRQHVETWNAGVAALSNVLLNVYLIPRFGVVGAALATGMSLLLLNALRLIQVRRLLGPLGLLSWSTRVVAVAGALAWWLRHERSSSLEWPALLAGVLIAGVWCMLAMLAVGIDTSQWRRLLELIRHSRSRS